MPWFKVDDALAMHMKAFAAGNQALGLWVRAGSWSMHQLSDGFIPKGVVQALGGDWDDAVALIQAGLWHEADGGYQFHDWAEYQPTREQVLAERAAATERKRASRARSRGESHRDDAGTDGRSPPSPSRPDPTRPDQSNHVPESSHVGNRASNTGTEDALAESVIRGHDIDPARLIAHIKLRTGRTVTPTIAMRVAIDLLAKGGLTVEKPQRYVLGSITRSWAEVQQAIDTVYAIY